MQSYGSRCVKPPVLFGDVSRPEPMTVDWSRYAQSLTTADEGDAHRTGHHPPVVVRPRRPAPQLDVPQIALAMRDEVVDLEAAGIAIIQIDEPAMREGLPLHDDGPPELPVVGGARLSPRRRRACADETQIHTHMCYPSSTTSSRRSRPWTPT